MMVVIGIVAILSAFVVPGIKKAYGDYKIRETYDCADTIQSAMLSFYLIFSETASGTWSSAEEFIDVRAVPFLPAKWLNTSRRQRYDAYDCCKLQVRNFLYLFKYLRVSGLAVWFYFKKDERPYYSDDLIDRYSRKNYVIVEQELNPGYPFIYAYPGIYYGKKEIWFQ